VLTRVRLRSSSAEGLVEPYHFYERNENARRRYDRDARSVSTHMNCKGPTKPSVLRCMAKRCNGERWPNPILGWSGTEGLK
jgi:hypothetical protein